MTQTAVEWFVKQLSSYTTTDGNIISHHQNITHLFEQAKEMEKEQIENAFNYGVYDGGGLIKKYKMSGEIYYNETFKSE